MTRPAPTLLRLIDAELAAHKTAASAASDRMAYYHLGAVAALELVRERTPDRVRPVLSRSGARECRRRQKIRR